MTRSRALVSGVSLVLAVFAAAAYCDSEDADQIIEIDIRIAPNTLVLGDAGAAVTVHAAIPYSVVVTNDDDEPITLAGVHALYSFADDCGNLVSKFNPDAIKDVVDPPIAMLILEGMTKDGESFIGCDTVEVKVKRRKK